MKRKGNPNIDSQDRACMRSRDLKETEAGTPEQSEESQGDREASVGAGKGELETGQQKEWRCFSDFICGDRADFSWEDL